MLAIWAKHTKIQCARAESCDTCSNERMYCFRRFRKICW